MEHYRRAEKAGSWYPADPSELKALLSSYLQTAKDITSSANAPKPIAAIVPHAGFIFSGGCAALAYHLLAQSAATPQTIIVFGAVHTTHLKHPGVWSQGSWQTPLGDIEVDKELAAKIIATGAAEENFFCHNGDNAIELQTPFIRYLFPKSRILPIATPAINQSLELGIELANILATEPLDKYLVVGSTDLTHYGSAYGFAPAGGGAAGIEWARENDNRLLELISRLAAEKILPETQQQHNACGGGAIAATLSYTRARGREKGCLLSHILSADLMPADEPCDLSVGYASIII